MTAEERSDRAITITRTILRWVLDDSKAMIMFVNGSVTPEFLQDEVFMILEYLELTAPDKSKETEEE